MPEERKLTGNEAEKTSMETAAVGTDKSDVSGEKTSNPHDKGYKLITFFIWIVREREGRFPARGGGNDGPGGGASGG